MKLRLLSFPVVVSCVLITAIRTGEVASPADQPWADRMGHPCPCLKVFISAKNLIGSGWNDDEEVIEVIDAP